VTQSRSALRIGGFMVALGILSPQPSRGDEVDIFLAAGGAEIEWGHRTFAGGVRVVVGRLFVEPSYLDIRSGRVDDVHRGLSFQVGIGTGPNSGRYYGAVGVKPAGINVTWASAGGRFRVHQHLVITPEVRVGFFGSEPVRKYLQLAVSLGTSIGL
jgi:hypothetical protein